MKPISSNLSFKPSGEILYASLKVVCRRIAQQFTSKTDVRKTMPDVSHPECTGDLRLNVLFERPSYFLGDLTNGDAFTASHVDRNTVYGALQSQPACACDIINANEIAQLFAIFENNRAL